MTEFILWLYFVGVVIIAFGSYFHGKKYTDPWWFPIVAGLMWPFCFVVLGYLAAEFLIKKVWGVK